MRYMTQSLYYFSHVAQCYFVNLVGCFGIASYVSMLLHYAIFGKIVRIRRRRRTQMRLMNATVKTLFPADLIGISLRWRGSEITH